MVPRVVNAGNHGPFTLDGTRTYLVGTRNVAVIDPGPRLDGHLAALLDALADADEVAVLVTHWHDDHAGLAGRLASEVGSRGVLGPGARADIGVTDGDTVKTDAGDLAVVATPGHAREHVCLYQRAEGALFAGDLVLGEGETTWVGEYDRAVLDYLESLARVRALSPEIVYPAHGPPVGDVQSVLDRYEAHRRARIRQVAEALREAPDAGLDHLLAEVYGRVPPDRLGAARRSLESILHFLRS